MKTVFRDIDTRKVIKEMDGFVYVPDRSYVTIAGELWNTYGMGLDLDAQVYTVLIFSLDRSVKNKLD